MIGATGAAQHAGATRAELAQWLESLRAAGIEVAAPLSWRYAFSARSTARLEALSLELVAAGYAIETMAAAPSGGAGLFMTRTELLTPAALERRDRELAALARKHGARYDGIDVAVGGR
jgi:hypothetical protein